jgi:hypothetical protein
VKEDHRGRGHGLVVEPALNLVAAGGADHDRLFLGLDPLGGHVHAQRAGDGDAGDHHRPRSGVGGGFDHKAAVDLELFEAELAQEPDRSIAGTEVVEDDPDAEIANHCHAASCDLGIDHQVGFGDFQFQPVCGKPRFLQHLPDLDRKFRIAQLGGRNIDRKLDSVPTECFEAGLAQDPFADGVDDARFLGHRNEHVWADLHPVAAFPPQQSLDRDDSSAVGIDQRLIVKPELVVIETVPKRPVKFADRVAVAVKLLAEPGATHFARPFRGVHRHVGLPQQLGRAEFGVGGTARQADAGADGDRAVVDVKRTGQPHQQLAADSFQDIAGDRPRHEHRELVAAQTVDPGLVAADFVEQRCAVLDQPVADEVAVVVVDLLEAVEIDQRQGGFLPGHRQTLNVEVQRATVGQHR